MKQKQLLTIRAFLCLALTVILGVLCMFPLFEVNVKVSDSTADDIIEVLENKKGQISYTSSLSENEREKQLKSCDEIIYDLQKARYLDVTFGSYEITLAAVIAESMQNGTPLPYGFETEEDVEKWTDEISSLLEEEENDENRNSLLQAFDEKCSEWSSKESMLKADLSEAAKKELETEVH